MCNSFNENLLDTISAYFDQFDESDQAEVLAMFKISSIFDAPAAKQESLLSEVMLAACD